MCDYASPEDLRKAAAEGMGVQGTTREHGLMQGLGLHMAKTKETSIFQGSTGII